MKKAFPKKRWFVAFSSISCLYAVLAMASNVCFAQEKSGPERPATEDLLPETTVGFFQIDNMQDFISKLSDTSVGRMATDDSIAPLIEGMWSEAKTAYSDIEEEVGVALDDLTSLPSGEFTFAVIAPRRQDPEYMLIMQTDPESAAVDRVLERGREMIREDGKEIEVQESEDGFEFESFMAGERKVHFFRHDGLLVTCTSEAELTAFVDRWMGRPVEKVRPLSANRKFVTIMNRCFGTKDLKPEARFFMDPIAAARSATRGNAGAQFVINFLPVLGLDGLLGVGGSLLLNEDEFASVAHAHVLLAQPRTGVFEMLAFKPTDYKPEAWLPSDVSNYFTTSWDVNQMIVELTKIVETFQGEGSVERWFENVDEGIGFDVREEILGALTGRVTWAQWIEPPMRVNSQVNLVALELKDPVEFEATLDKIIARANRDEIEKGTAENELPLIAIDYQGIRLIGPPEELAQNRFNERRERRRQRLEEGALESIEIDLKPPTPTIALVGNYLILSPQSREFVRRIIDTDRGEVESLRESEEYKSVAEKMTRLLKTDMPVGILFAKPSEAFKWMLDLMKSESSQSLLADRAAENQYVAGVKRVMDENPLPEFSELEENFQPQGGFMTSDDTGLHFLFFEMKP